MKKLCHISSRKIFFLFCLTLGIAFIWFEPYYNMTKTNAYHGLLKEAVENGLVKQEDLA